MKNNIKRFLALLMISLSIGIIPPVMAENMQTESPEPAVETTTKLPTRMPYGKKALAFKFLMAMLGVGASSVIIYVLLSIYNRFIYGSPSGLQDKTEDDDFKTPTNMKDAINIFLKKTK